MEYFDQPHGVIIYRTQLPPGNGERLLITDVHDYGQVFLDNRRVGIVDRSQRQSPILLPSRETNSVLDIVVESMGRVNFGETMLDHKGITQNVQLADGSSVRALTGWEIYNLPLREEYLSNLKFAKGKQICLHFIGRASG